MSTTQNHDKAFLSWMNLMLLHHDIVDTVNRLYELKAIGVSQQYVAVSYSESAIRHTHETLVNTIPFTKYDSAYVGYLQTNNPNKLERGIMTTAEYWDEFLRYATTVML